MHSDAHSRHMLRIVFFCTSDIFGRTHLAAVARTHTVVGVVQPRAQVHGRGLGRLWRRVARRLRLRPTLLERHSRELGAPCWTAAGRHDARLAPLIAAARPDLLCIAGYPWILSPEEVATARLGALNVHPSLLPRHRGVIPLIWTYLADDREAGVTVHWASQRVDAGDIVKQRSVPLPRGLPVETLHRQLADEGAGMLAAAVDSIENGTAPRVPQDESRATSARLIKPGASAIDFAAWDVERAWHVLAGLLPRWREPLRDESGRRIIYDGVSAWQAAAHGLEPGSVVTIAGGWRLHCRGGTIDLAGLRTVP